ncbi:hypothetical protein EON64_01200 [archaeon]|nr:MAG: hypothetical protein EON64_01200 [archaeon]
MPSDPMRITKKYAGTSSIGKQIYSPCEEFHAISEEIRRGEEDLLRLEQLFLTRISSKGSFVEEEPEAAEPLRRNAPRNCSKTDLAALLQEDQDSSQKMRGKRVRSAPDLSEMYTRFPSSRFRDYSG